MTFKWLISSQIQVWCLQPFGQLIMPFGGMDNEYLISLRKPAKSLYYSGLISVSVGSSEVYYLHALCLLPHNGWTQQGMTLIPVGIINLWEVSRLPGAGEQRLHNAAVCKNSIIYKLTSDVYCCSVDSCNRKFVLLKEASKKQQSCDLFVAGWHCDLDNYTVVFMMYDIHIVI